MLEIISRYINNSIIVAGIVVFVALFYFAVKIGTCKNEIAEAVESKKSDRNYNKKTKGLEEIEEDAEATDTLENVRKKEKKFNNICSWYNAVVQLVPLFPLLGILGTVAALMNLTQIQEDASQLAETLYNELNTALGSTLYGMICAILLKVFIALCPARMVNDVEVVLDDFDKKYGNLLTTKNLEE